MLSALMTCDRNNGRIVLVVTIWNGPVRSCKCSHHLDAGGYTLWSMWHQSISDASKQFDKKHNSLRGQPEHTHYASSSTTTRRSSSTCNGLLARRNCKWSVQHTAASAHSFFSTTSSKHRGHSLAPHWCPLLSISQSQTIGRSKKHLCLHL